MSTRTLLLCAFSYLLVLALIAFGVPLGIGLAQRADDEIRARARSQADIVAVAASTFMRPTEPADLRRLAVSAGESVRGRVVIADSTGRLVADSASVRTLGTNYSNRPEIAAALNGRRVQDRRNSATLGRELLVTAAPVRVGVRTVGAVRITQSVKAVSRAVRRSVAGLLAVAAAVLALGMVAALVLARQLARPLRNLELAAEAVAGGDLDARAPVSGAREQRALAEAFNSMTTRVGRSMKAQQDFVADASHQLRTPLTGLRLRLEEADAIGGADPDLHTQLSAATDELDRLAVTIDELLVLSSGGERDAPGAVLSLADVPAAVQERWTAAAQERSHRLICRTQGDPGQVWCAAVDLERALDGVIENAVRYTPDGGSIEVVARRGAIDVLDTGSGIGSDETEHLFDRFHRGESGRRAGPGNGLGLTISRELLRRWGGDVTLAPRPQGGTHVRLSLPPFTNSLDRG